MELQTTVGFLDALRAHYELSDRQSARLIGVSQTAVSNWRTGRDFPSDRQCRKLAALLKIDERYVVACVHEERARLPADKQMWRSIAKELAGIAAALLVGIGLAGAPPPAQAAFNINPMCEPPEYTYAHKRRRRSASRAANRTLATLSALARYARTSLALSPF